MKMYFIRMNEIGDDFCCCKCLRRIYKLNDDDDFSKLNDKYLRMGSYEGSSPLQDEIGDRCTSHKWAWKC